MPRYVRKVMLFVVAVALGCGTAAAETGIVPADEIVRGLCGRAVKLQPKYDNQDYTTPETSNHVSLLTVQFALDSAELTAGARRQLDEVAKAIRQILSLDGNQSRFILEGHTCDLGTAAYNQDLSSRRASAARDYLVAGGIDGKLLDVQGRGQTRPVVPNTSETNRALNRRVDVIRSQTSRSVKKPCLTRGTITTRTTKQRFLEVEFKAEALSEDGKQYINDEIDVLKSGDKFKAYLTVFEGCHVYALLLDSRNTVTWLRLDAPRGGGENWQLFPTGVNHKEYGLWCYYDEERSLPNADECYVLDGNPGTEVLCILATHSLLDQPGDLESILKRQGSELTAEAVQEATGVKDAELHVLFIDHR